MNTPYPPSAPLRHDDYTVGWICALSLEMAAASAMLDTRHGSLSQNPSDHNTYTFGAIGPHNVVVACLPVGSTGTTPAATVAAQMLLSFPAIRFGLMVGIGGGVPSEAVDIRLGDVVVSEPQLASGGVIQYDFGKTIQEGRFIRTGSLNKPPQVLLTAISKLKSDHMIESPKLAAYISDMIKKYPHMQPEFAYPGSQHDQLFNAYYEHEGDSKVCQDCDPSRILDRSKRSLDCPKIHYGLIASGNQVMKHGITRDKLRDELGVLCFEMEAAGLMDGFPCLVIRGICDYADSHKNKRWQPYAAATAAAYARELLCVIPRNTVSSTRSVPEAATSTGKSLPQPLACATLTDDPSS